METFSLRNRFRAVVTGNDVSRGKPDPALFLLAAQALEVDPAHIVVFEDAVAGILAAKAAGMRCVGIAANGRESLLKEAGADFVMKDFRDVTVNDLKSLFLRANPEIIGEKELWPQQEIYNRRAPGKEHGARLLPEEQA